MLRQLTILTAQLVVLAQLACAQTIWTGSGDGINWTDAANWSTGFEPNGLAEDVLIDGNAGVATIVELGNTNRSVGSLTVDAGDQLELLRSTGFTAASGINNDGVIRLNFAGIGAGGTNLSFLGTQTLNGSGELILSDEPLNSIGLAGVGTILTHEVGHTIRGAGTILHNGNTRTINNGTIVADGANNALVIQQQGFSVFTNNGVLRAAGTGGMRLVSGTYENNNLMEVLDGSFLDLSTAAVVRGGELRTVGTGRVDSDGFLDLDGVTVAAGSTVNLGVNFNAATESLNGLTNNGRIALNPGNNAAIGSRFAFVGTQTLGGNGEIVMADQLNSVLDVANVNAVLTNGPNHTIRGAGVLMSNIETVTLRNEGTILAEGLNNPLIIDPGTGGQFVNDGVLRATGAGGLQLNPGRHINNTVIEAANGSAVLLTTGMLLQGGELATSGTGSIQLANLGFAPAPILDGVTNNTDSVVIINPPTGDARLDLVNGFTNDGTVLVNPGLNTTNLNQILAAGTQTISGAGEIVLSDSPNNEIGVFLPDAVLTNGPNHTIRGAGSILNDQDRANFRNEGTIIADGPTHPLRVDPGSASTFENAPSGTLTGNGRFEFVDGTFANAGRVAPGQKIGTLTITGDVTNSITATLDVELDVNVGDLLDVQGAYAAGGELDIELIAGSVDPLQAFTILTASSGVSGFFENAAPNGSGVANHLVNGQLFDVTYESNAITIRKQEPVPPTPASLQITEIYTGVTGEDGTLDWIEVTNLGGTPADTGTLIFDDESLNVNNGGDLPSFILESGESAIFLFDDDNNIGETQAIADFLAIWGPVDNVGYTEGGGNLPASGNDAAAIMLADGSIVDLIVYPELPSGAAGAVTVDISDGGGTNGVLGFSTLGINGAYESNPFFNNDIGSGNPPMITLIGSPGIAGKPLVAGDFDGNGQQNVNDLNLLLSLGPLAAGVAVTPGANDQFDLNGDGQIDLADRDVWLADAAAANGLASPYQLGDANLDGAVDGQDFILWNASKFTSTLLWNSGDFNGDGVADGQDFIEWNANKFTSSDLALASVPEPKMSHVWLFVIGMLALRTAFR